MRSVKFTNEELEYIKNNLEYDLDTAKIEEVELGISIEGDEFSIFLEKKVNDYGVVFYSAVVELWDIDEEIPFPESVHDGYGLEEEDYEKMEEEGEKEIEEIEEAPTVEFKVMGEEYSFTKAVIEQKCYINIPHYHYYRGFRAIYDKIQSLSKLIVLINMTDIFESFYNSALEKVRK